MQLLFVQTHGNPHVELFLHLHLSAPLLVKHLWIVSLSSFPTGRGPVIEDSQLQPQWLAKILRGHVLFTNNSFFSLWSFQVPPFLGLVPRKKSHNKAMQSSTLGLVFARLELG